MLTREIITGLIDRYGVDTQLIVACSELSELSREIQLHQLGREDFSRENLIKEIDHVYFMLLQVCMIFEVTHKELSAARQETNDKVISKYLGENHG